MNVPLQGGSNVAAEPVGDGVGRANAADAAVTGDPLAAIVDRHDARGERHGFSTRGGDLVKVQIERRVLVDESESHALHRFQLSGEQRTRRQNGFLRAVARIQNDRGDQHGAHGIARTARIGANGGQKADVQLGALRHLFESKQIESQQHIGEAHGYLFYDRRIGGGSGNGRQP